MSARAVVIESFEDQPGVVYTDVPVPGKGEVLIRVHAASINAFDWKAAEGRFKDNFDYQFPVTIGRDYSGVVEAVGSGVGRANIGDSVFGYFTGMKLGPGAFADYICIDQHSCFVAKPEEISFLEASCLPLCGIVAHRAVEAVQPAEGARILIIGAPGGAGSYAVQFAAARGAHVIATGLPDDLQYLHDLGAAEVLDQRESVVDQVRSGHEPVHGLIDFVSNRTAFTEHAALLTAGGRAASTHNGAAEEDLEPRGIAGTNVNSAPDPELLIRLGAAAVAGDLRVPIRRVFSLDDAPLGLELLKNEHARGKLAIDIVQSTPTP